MIRDGKFIRDYVPKIGSVYDVTKTREYTPDELFMQEVLLANKEAEQRLSKLLKKFLGTFAIH